MAYKASSVLTNGDMVKEHFAAIQAMDIKGID